MNINDQAYLRDLVRRAIPCICDTNPDTTDGPDGDCRRHGRDANFDLAALRDLDDPGTIGHLLEITREAMGSCDFEISIGDHCSMVSARWTIDDDDEDMEFDTLALALVAALEAAAERPQPRYLDRAQLIEEYVHARVELSEMQNRVKNLGRDLELTHDERHAATLRASEMHLERLREAARKKQSTAQEPSSETGVYHRVSFKPGVAQLLDRAPFVEREQPTRCEVDLPLPSHLNLAAAWADQEHALEMIQTWELAEFDHWLLDSLKRAHAQGIDRVTEADLRALRDWLRSVA